MTANEISRLVYAYCRALDRLDADLLRSVFHVDARIELGSIYCGAPGGFVPVAMDFMRAMKATRHGVTNILALPGGFESYVDAWHLIERDGQERELVVRARYLQQAEVRDGRLALSYHSEVVDFGEERPVDGGWFSGDIGMAKARRDGTDPSFGLQAR